MKLVTKLTGLLAVAVVLAGCTKDVKPVIDGANVDGYGQVTGVDGNANGNNVGYGENGYGAGSGTQQDLVVNVGDRVFFGYDQANLTAEGRSILERQSEWLKQHSNLRVTLEGHTDERGTREYNLALGEKRANSARKYLMALGVDGSRIETLSYGKERPAALGANASAWAENRRSVTIVD